MLAGIPTLKKDRTPLAVARLELGLDIFQDELERFTQSPEVAEILQLSPSFVVSSTHAECCPPLPFIPYVLQFPPAGYLRLYLFALRNYLHIFVEPSLRDKPIEADESYAYEVCRTFAGIELSFDKDALLPCFSTMCLAGLSCPSNVRMWLWYKLAHFEELGQFTIEPIKKVLSVLWDMPTLVAEGFNPWKKDPPVHNIRRLNADDIDIVTKLVHIELDDNEDM